ncbi:MAG TPA: FG-GAP-like repeat-containing protein, partial [Candidatus Binatia bacterium]
MERSGAKREFLVIALFLILAISMCLPWYAAAQSDKIPGMSLGSFKVSNNGAAAYTIPLITPAGINGIAPKLSLVYDSQRQNGLLGMGWSLEGLPTITRCPRTVAQDGAKGGVNLDTSDRFCLDGQRLMAITTGTYGAAGMEYRTEMDTFVRVFSNGQVSTPGSGPLSFTVKNKAGETLEFGNDSLGTSRIEAQGKTTVRVWALSKISDTSGNFMTVTYDEDSTNGDYRPLEIKYTGNGANATQRSVKFFYGDRSDKIPTYVGGSLVKVMKLLTTIQTWAPSTSSSGPLLVREYRLAYENGSETGRSRLTSITECSTSTCVSAPDFPCVLAGTCLPPTKLTYRQGGTGSFLQPVPWNLPNSQWNALKAWGGDFDADGMSDIAAPANGLINNFVSNGDGTYTPTPSDGYNIPNQLWDSTRAWRGDFNGDGRVDLASAVGGFLYTYLATSDGSYDAKPGFNIPNQLWDSTKVWIGDFDGDGRTDFASAVSSVLYTYLSNGDGTYNRIPTSGFPLPTQKWDATKVYNGDFNGDGKTDFASATGGFLYTYLSNGDGTYNLTPTGGFNTPSSKWDAFKVWNGDFNADGKTDFTSATGGILYTYFSKGDGTYDLTPLTGFTLPNQQWDSTKVWPGDYNGDSRTDLASVVGGFVYSYLSKGDGTYDPKPSNLPNQQWDSTKAWSGDFNGDGKSDLASAVGGFLYTYTADGVFPDLLASITNNFGGKIDLTYKPLTDSSVYTKENDAVYPIMDMQAPIYVVDNYIAQTQGDANGQNFQFTLDYGGAKFDHRGRGGLGFRWIRTVDETATVNPSNPLSKSQTTNYFHQVDPSTHQAAFPKIGLINFSETVDTQDLTHPFAQLTNTYTPTNTAHPTVFFPALTLVVKSQCDGLDGCLHTAAKFEYDIFGNQTRTFNWGEVTAQEIATGQFVLSGDERDEQTEWVSDTAPPDHWLHRPKHVLMVDPNSNPANKVLRERWLYYDDQNHGLLGARALLTKEESRAVTGTAGDRTAPGNPVVTHHYNSVFGNRDFTIDPIGCKTETTAFDFTNTFPITIVRCSGDPNPNLIHTTTFTWDPRFGVKTTEKGPCICSSPTAPLRTFTYDAFGRLTKAEGPIDFNPSPAETRAYVSWGDPLNQRVQIRKTQNEGQAGTVLREEFFDGLGRFYKVQYDGPAGLTIREDSIYDSRNLMISKVPARFTGETALPATTFVYDVMGRQVKVTHPDGLRHADVIYDPGVVTLIDENGHQKIKILDAYGQVVEIDEINHVNNAQEIYKTFYDYDDTGALIQVTQTGTNSEFNLITTMTYDPLGRKIEMVDPNMGQWTYEYDKAGNLVAQVDPNLRALGPGKLTFEFDSHSRMTKKIYPNSGGQIVFTYDQNLNSVGRLSRIDDLNSMVTAFSYDLKGRIIRTDRTIGATHSLTQTYNALDQVTNETFLDDNHSVNYAYDKGFLTQIFDGVGPDYVTSIGYNARGQKTTVLYGNTVTTSIGYFDQNIPGQKINFLPKQRFTGGGSLQNLEYVYDNVGNITNIIDNTTPNPTAGRDFTYDDLNRLTSASGRFGPPSGGLPTQVTNQQHAYDSIGNLLTKGSITYQYCNHPNPLNSAPPSLCGGTLHPSAVVKTIDSSTSVEKTYQYDDNGNTLNRKNLSVTERSLTWTPDNRVASVTQGSTSFMDYDYTGIRLKKTFGSAVTVYPFSDFEIGPD